ncbi:Serine/threonine-protein kinases PknA [Corynebacterium deserti GIMN1.010]|uniref:non-specific serine/threonine protein kinase n=1 Tax=Corynebacterium deserti GIMN1.010 TaxID=931089 RepID=A0A0M3Q8V8_9CORY|nr:serine/threonine-protein kinase [Corynebacterium deserti]ALC04523.1 Serine/threonine-protein kinases PknA [Corynebacterium deserti GIMN1.010]
MSQEDITGKDRLQELIGADYRLQWIIGHGGMSTVWLADDVVNDREVAIKVLRPEFSDNREFLSRFRNEAQAAENIDSEHVVATYDYREVPDPAGHTFCFIVMEYVRGESLADMLEREGSLPEDLALDVLEQAAHGLSVIHRMNMVHRDIKPGNMLITANGIVKITDFGIAKAAAAVPLTRTGMVVGTAQYVSPEQAQGKEVTSASDVYSLGVVGYEMMAGRRPFSGDSSVSVAIAHINQAPPQMPVSISAQTRELIGISLRKDPGRRFPNGNEMALAVSAVRLGQRPPQPRTSAMMAQAEAPSPSASTAMLGKVARPNTVATGVNPATGARPVTMTQEAQPKGSGIGIGLFIAALLAVIIGAVIYAGTTGILFNGTSDETTTPETITETYTPTVEETTSHWVPPTTAPRTTSSIPETTSQQPTTSEEETSEEPTSEQPTSSQTVPQIPTSTPRTSATVPEETSAPADELVDAINGLLEVGGAQ